MTDPLCSLCAAHEFAGQAPEAGGQLLERALDRARTQESGRRPIHAFLSLAEPPPGAGPPASRSPAGSPLAGIPIAVKDNICTLGLPTTCGSRILEAYVSPFAATAVRRLERAGAWILGKTNLDEFAMGSSTETSAYGPTRNPVDLDRVPGGSSGGSAAAVAAGVVPVALGSSTGGSVRQPAAMCGVVGVKPTYGRVSRYGLVAFASSLDHIGVFARSVRDAAHVLEAIAGCDERDATSGRQEIPRAAALDDVDLSGAAIGVPGEYLGAGLDGRSRRLFERAVETAERGGARVVPISLPTTSAAIACYYVVAPAEASANLARYDGSRYGLRSSGAEAYSEAVLRTRGEGFGEEVRRRILLGTYVLSAGYREAYYRRALDVRRTILEDFRRAFARVDAVFAPTTPTHAFRLGEKADPYEMYRSDVYTVAANLAGIPAVSIPIGNVDGLPVGAQLMCGRWQEEQMLGIAATLEELLEYRHPLTRR